MDCEHDEACFDGACRRPCDVKNPCAQMLFASTPITDRDAVVPKATTATDSSAVCQVRPFLLLIEHKKKKKIPLRFSSFVFLQCILISPCVSTTKIALLTSCAIVSTGFASILAPEIPAVRTPSVLRKITLFLAVVFRDLKETLTSVAIEVSFFV